MSIRTPWLLAVLLLFAATSAGDARSGRLFPRKGSVSVSGNATPPGAAGLPGCTREAALSGKALPFGCANALNLEAMLADPAHLRAPAPLAPPIGDLAIHPVERLRRGDAPAPPPAPTSSALEAQAPR
ncbi:hypothetical protein [Thermaurantiacus sp.]